MDSAPTYDFLKNSKNFMTARHRARRVWIWCQLRGTRSWSDAQLFPPAPRVPPTPSAWERALHPLANCPWTDEMECGQLTDTAAQV